MLLRWHRWILEVGPALEASKASGDGVHVTALGVLPFLKASLKNRPSSCRRFLEESLTVPVVLHFHSHWSVLHLLTLPGLLSWIS